MACAADVTHAAPGIVKPKGGYSVEIFPDGFADKFLCSACKKILRDPLQSYCGHRYCRTCMTSLASISQSVICVACQQEGTDESYYSILREDQMFPDKAVCREMAKMWAVCANVGCQWNGSFYEYEIHHGTCLHQHTECVCGESIPVNTLDTHKESECAARTVKCPYCNKQIMFKDKQAHNQICPKYHIVCESCRNPDIPRDMMEHHMTQECPSAGTEPISCPIGCQEMVERRDIETHLKSKLTKHLQVVLRHADHLDHDLQSRMVLEGQKVNEEIGRLNTRISQYEQKIKLLEARNRTPSTQSSGSGVSSVSGVSTLSTGDTPNLGSSTYMEVVTVLHKEVEKCIKLVTDYIKKGQEDRQAIEAAQQKMAVFERLLMVKDATIRDLEIRFEMKELATYNGVLLWRIADFTQRRQEAIAGKTTSVFSHPFYTSRHGYKMCARLYPNGDGMGKNSHLSLFFVIMRGMYDALIKWPFKQKITLTLLDQLKKQDIVDTFRADPNSSSFQRPTSEMNIASGCPLFLPLVQLEGSSNIYMKDDVMFVKIIVDCAGLENQM